MSDPIWKHVSVINEKDCWAWDGGTSNGYAMYYDPFLKQAVSAVRAVWMLVHKKMLKPDDKLRKWYPCDKVCVNPHHYRLIPKEEPDSLPVADAPAEIFEIDVNTLRRKYHRLHLYSHGGTYEVHANDVIISRGADRDATLHEAVRSPKDLGESLPNIDMVATDLHCFRIRAMPHKKRKLSQDLYIKSTCAACNAEKVTFSRREMQVDAKRKCNKCGESTAHTNVHLVRCVDYLRYRASCK